MPDSLITFDHVELLKREAFGFRCRIEGREVFIGSLQPQPGTTVDSVGDRLVLRRAEAAHLGLIAWKPSQ